MKTESSVTFNSNVAQRGYILGGGGGGGGGGVETGSLPKMYGMAL